MISVFTPSHNTKWLNDCYESLCAQTYTDWEWVVLLNGKAKDWSPSEEDSRVKVAFVKPQLGENIGALKRYAVELCTGDILVELDHDDILMPTALEEIDAAISNSNYGFCYSDFAQINEDGSPDKTEFNKAFGWTYYDDADGYHVCESMDVHPHNVSYIWFAPNHLRAFTRQAYNKTSGYDPNLDILDDQDIIGKLYAVTDFYHIKKNLYLQRIHGANTQKREDKNARIQRETVIQYDRSIQPLMLKWSKENNLLALDFGAAHNPAPGYLSIDMHAPADYIGDIFEVLETFEDNSVGIIRAVDFFEHIPDKIRLWNEMYRVLAHGGMIVSLTPSTDGRGAFQDPTHNSFYNENSFWYFAYEEHRKYVPELKMDFHVSRLVTYFPNDFCRSHDIPYVCANLVARKEKSKFGGKITL